jgi:hypothetical protein
LYLANDPGKLGPHSTSLAVKPIALSGNGDVLARKPSRYHVNKSAPRLSVKCLNVIPNRERREKAFILSSGKYSGGIGFPFDGADGAPSEQLSAKDTASGPCEKREFS